MCFHVYQRFWPPCSITYARLGENKRNINKNSTNRVRVGHPLVASSRYYLDNKRCVSLGPSLLHWSLDYLAARIRMKLCVSDSQPMNYNFIEVRRTRDNAEPLVWSRRRNFSSLCILFTLCTPGITPRPRGSRDIKPSLTKGGQEIERIKKKDKK